MAATRVLHDGLFTYGPDASSLDHDATDRAVLVVALERDGQPVGVIVLADRSGRVFSDQEVALAEGVTHDVSWGIQRGRGDETAYDVVERLLQLLGGETAAMYAVADDGAELSLVAAVP